MIPIARALALLLLAPVALTAQIPATSPTALSVEEAIAIARANSPEYLAQRNDLEVARWARRNAYQEFLPTAYAASSFGYEASGTQRFGSTIDESPSFYTSNYQLGISYDLSGAKLLRPSLLRAQALATTGQVASAEARLVADVTQQYLAVLEAQEEVAQAERELLRTGAQLRLAQARQEVGVGIALDVRRAEVQQGTAEVRLLRAQNNVALQKITLGQRIGAPLSDSVRIASEFRLFDPALDPAVLFAAALRNNPALLAARAQANAAETDVRIARSNYLPRLGFDVGVGGFSNRPSDLDPLIDQGLNRLGVQFAQCTDQNRIRQTAGLSPLPCAELNPADPLVADGVRDRFESQYGGFPFSYTQLPARASVTISLPLYTGIGRPLELQRSRAAAEDALLQVRAQELRLQTDVAAAVQNTRTAYQAALLERRVRETAAEELRLAEERFRAGVASSVEVIDAQTRLSETEQREINAVYTFHQSLALLEALVGQDLRGGARL